jgi:hypothetical protein
LPTAIDEAEEIAEDKHVVVGASSVAKECLGLGGLDEIRIGSRAGGARWWDLRCQVSAGLLHGRSPSKL